MIEGNRQLTGLNLGVDSFRPDNEAVLSFMQLSPSACDNLADPPSAIYCSPLPPFSPLFRAVSAFLLSGASPSRTADATYQDFEHFAQQQLAASPRKAAWAGLSYLPALRNEERDAFETLACNLFCEVRRKGNMQHAQFDPTAHAGAVLSGLLMHRSLARTTQRCTSVHLASLRSPRPATSLCFISTPWRFAVAPLPSAPRIPRGSGRNVPLCRRQHLPVANDRPIAAPSCLISPPLLHATSPSTLPSVQARCAPPQGSLLCTSPPPPLPPPPLQFMTRTSSTTGLPAAGTSTPCSVLAYCNYIVRLCWIWIYHI